MKTLIICSSICHGNTKKVAEVMAKTIKAELLGVKDTDIKKLDQYNLIGFGSGIFYAKHHKSILDLVDIIPPSSSKKAFIFSTSGLTNSRSVNMFHKPLREKLIKKGYNIVGEFNCAGLDTWGPYKTIGGIKKGHPNVKDMDRAKKFVKNILK